MDPLQKQRQMHTRIDKNAVSKKQWAAYLCAQSKDKFAVGRTISDRGQGNGDEPAHSGANDEKPKKCSRIRFD